MSSADRFNQFEQFKAEAAEQLGLPLDVDQVRLLATLKLSHENLLERLMRGDNVNPDQVRSVVEAISAMLPPAQVKLPKFQWASSVVGIYRCQHCNEINRLEESQYVAHPA